MNENGRIHIHLNTLLNKAGMSKNKFSEAANMQRSQINHFCNNEVTRFDADVLCRICLALNCTVGDLLEYVPPDSEKQEK